MGPNAEMPNSSRRKQAKPQHLRCQDDEDSVRTGNHNITSTPSVGDQPTQEPQHGSLLTGKHNGSGQTGETDTFSENSGEDHTVIVKNGEGNADLDNQYLRINLKDNNDSSDAGDYEDRGTPIPMFTPPSPHMADRFCVYCNIVKKSPADLERHLRKHTGDRPFACQGCDKSFKSKRSLQYHAYMNHGIEDADSNIAQRYGTLRKRRLEETQLASDLSPYKQEPVNLTSESSSNPLNFSMRPLYHSSETLPQENVNKRMRMDDFPTSQSQYSSAINSDLRQFDMGSGDNMDSSGDLARACQVCAKIFPKPSDLKRHMMCHTGEKPFKCEFCSKPFRAKSSMHYHLKAAHGLDIELSPGLEERYLRMKTRAHVNMIQKHNFSGVAQPGSDTASELSFYRDMEEMEEEMRSDDSAEMKSEFRVGIGSSSGMKEGNREGRNTENYEGVVIAAAEPFRRNQISIQNETVLVTRLDGLDMINGKTASVYKCYLCGKMFNSLSGIQCHLSLHFDKQLVSFECCFCDEIFTFKTQMRNHIRKKHGSRLRSNAGGDKSSLMIEKENNQFTKVLAAKAKESKLKSKKHWNCKYCRKMFLSVGSLQKHMKHHFWNRNCFCRMCGKSFTQYRSLQLHIARLHWTENGSVGTASHNLPQKLNFFKSYPSNKNGIVKRSIEMKKLPVFDRLKKNVTGVLPHSPSENCDLSDAESSHQSSDNWPENLSEHGQDMDENLAKIKVAPRRSLMSFHRENFSGKPQTKSPRKLASDTIDYPINYVKSEPGNQDTNNNESSREARLSPEYRPNISDSLAQSPYMNATNHLLLAKALAAHNVSQLTQNTMNTSTPYFPPTTLPPSLAAMNHMMSLSAAAMPVQDPNGPQASKSPSPASLSSSKSDQSPEDREREKEGLVGYPRVSWNQKGMADKLWNFNMFNADNSMTSDGRKVTSLSRTHSRLPIVHSPINREAMCKPTTTSDGRTVYKCPFCSKDFISFSDINRHMDFHEGKRKDIRPYKCQYCDYYARTNSQLKVHMMRHQGIREFCCKLCNYKGVTQSDLNRHMKSQIHMLKSRNACTFCGEGFVTSKNLEKHLDGNCIVKMQKMNGDLNIGVQETIA